MSASRIRSAGPAGGNEARAGHRWQSEPGRVRYGGAPLRAPRQNFVLQFCFAASRGSTNAFTKPSCATINGQQVCGTNIMTNNVELDTRNLIYIVDRAGSGADILALTGQAEKIG